MATEVERPYLTIRPGAGPIRQYLVDLWHHRDLIPVLAARDVKLRYRQTALGALWVVIQPVVGAGVLSFIFGRVAKLPADGVSYFLFAFCGTLAWTAFSNTLMRATGSLVAQSSLVSKIFFPRLVLPLSTVFGALVDFAVALVIFAVMLVANGKNPGLRVLTMPLWLALLLILALGLGFLLGSVAVTYRDIGQVTPVAVNLLFYLSPIAYATSAIPTRYEFAYNLNPVACLIEGFRWSLLNTSTPSAANIIYSIAFCIIIFLFGAFVLQQRERGFADVV